VHSSVHIDPDSCSQRGVFEREKFSLVKGEMLPSRMNAARAQLVRYNQVQQKRDLLVVVPVAIGVGVCAFVGITVYQVWKKRQMQEMQEQAKDATGSKEGESISHTKSGSGGDS
jgi:hypothetical protein